LRIGSLFSGYGGLDMAVSSVLGGAVAWHVEFDKAPSRILEHHYPDVPNHGDVTAVDWFKVEPVDVLTGGYPCQPFSHAGLRKGANDERHLWPEVLRAICVLGPRLVVLENVRGHLSLGFDAVLSDLARVGWDARWGVVRAADAGAPHRRARLFIVAYPAHLGHEWGGTPRRRGARSQESRDPATYADNSGQGRGARRLQPAKSESDTQGSRYLAANTVSSRRHGRSRDTVRGTLGRDAATGTSGSPVEWGDYGPAIARWEHVIGRPAPSPTEPGRTGNPRLAPRFVEWMMGLPDGHVTDPAIGISRNDQLKALGNGVVPQQAALALDVLLQGTPYDIRQTLATV
jgi:DNA (cytosine-5)-methyltransferase 1